MDKPKFRLYYNQWGLIIYFKPVNTAADDYAWESFRQYKKHRIVYYSADLIRFPFPVFSF